jgi:hypothetical protein
MCISPFSTNNILIHKGIYSNNLFRGPSTNFLSASLKESLYLMVNSTMYPSFTQLNQKLIAQAHLLSIDFSLLTVVWSHTNGSWTPREVLIVVLPLQPFIQQTRKLNKENFMQICVDIPLFPTFNIGYQILGLSSCKLIFLIQITSLVFPPEMDSTSFFPFIMQYKTFRSQQQWNHLLVCISPIVGGLKTQGSSIFDQQNPKASTYSIFSQGPKKVSPKMP